MNKVWEIIEHRKSSEGIGPMESSYRMSRKSGGMSGHKYSDEYSKGVKDGFCAAVEMLEEAVDSMSRE